MYLLAQTLKHVSRILDLVREISIDADRQQQIKTSTSSWGVSISAISRNTYTLEEELDQLVRLYEGQAFCRRFRQAAETAQAMREDIEAYYDHLLSVPRIWHFMLPGNILRLKRYEVRLFSGLPEGAQRLQKQIQDGLSGLISHATTLMPIPLSEQTAQYITYEAVRLSPQAQIQLVFSLFEDHLRQKLGVGSEVFGEALINVAYAADGELVYSDMGAEQQGIRNLMAGACAVLRNPRMHRILGDDEIIALTVISLVDLLMRLIDQSRAAGP